MGRNSIRYFLFLIAGVQISFSPAGCGPRKLLPLPAELPAKFGERLLWHTPRAYIYAADKGVAGETDAWIGELAGHIQRTYRSELGKGLVIVVGEGEAGCVASLDELVRLRRQTAAAVGVPEKAIPTLAEQRRKLDESGMSEQLACLISAVALDEDAITRLGLSRDLPEDVAWCICCPSQRFMASAMWVFAPTAIEKKKGRIFAIATAWAWPLAFPEAAKTLRLARDVAAFQSWCVRQEDWSASERLAQIASYKKQRAFLISPTLALALAIAERQGQESPDNAFGGGGRRSGDANPN